MTITAAYTELCTVPGTWMYSVQLPATPFSVVRDELTLLAETRWPVAALAYGTVDQPVEELTLYRSPSPTAGVSSLDECEAAARTLLARTGWGTDTGTMPATGLHIALGLHGNDSDAAHHAPDVVTNALTTGGDAITCRPARLASARLIDGTVHWHDEPGVAIHTKTALLPNVIKTTRALSQPRMVVTDTDSHLTYILQR